MKIAYIYDVIYPYVKGGAEKRFWELARRLSVKGHEVHLYGMKFWQGQDIVVREGVYLHGICAPKKLYGETGKRNVTQVLYFTLHLPCLWKENFDIVDCNVFPYIPFFLVRLYSWLKRTPLVVTWQEVWDNYWYKYMGRVKGFIARRIEKLAIVLAKDIIVYSQTVKNDLLRCGASAKKIHLISQGIDLRKIKVVVASPERSELLFAGRLIREKNVDILIKAVSLLKRVFGVIKCIIIGDGPEKERLIKLTRDLNLEDNVVFKGLMEYEELVSYMKASRVFVFPSIREGFGIVVMEAMACGLPVITVNHPMNAAGDFVKDGENGFICDLDEKDIAHKVSELLRDITLRQRFSHAAEDYVKGYDWDNIASESEEFYLQLIDKLKS